MLFSIKKELHKRSYSKSNQLLVDFLEINLILDEILSWIISRAKTNDFLMGGLVHKWELNVTQFVKKNTASQTRNESILSLVHEFIVSLRQIYILP